MGLTLNANYTQEKEYFQEYLNWTRRQNELLQVEDTDTNALEASIYQREVLIGHIIELHKEAEWLSRSLPPGPAEEEIRAQINGLLVEIDALEKENLKLADRRKSFFGEELRKMRNEHKAARGYNSVGFYPQARIFDETK